MQTDEPDEEVDLRPSVRLADLFGFVRPSFFVTIDTLLLDDLEGDAVDEDDDVEVDVVDVSDEEDDDDGEETNGGGGLAASGCSGVDDIVMDVLGGGDGGPGGPGGPRASVLVDLSFVSMMLVSSRNPLGSEFSSNVISS